MSQLNHGLNPTKLLPKPTEYVKALVGEYSNWAYCEERSPLNKGQWREEVFKSSKTTPVDVEIGTGNGTHFAHYAKNHPERNLVGLEVKYKPLVQTIRRALNSGCENVRICRYDGGRLPHLFEKEEVNNVIIHHPDPWPKKRDWKKRLIQNQFLLDLIELQKPGSFVDFKTDDLPYFEWALEKFESSPYSMVGHTFDLHNSEFAKDNFVTTFENIFIQRGQPIYFCKLQKSQ